MDRIENSTNITFIHFPSYLTVGLDCRVNFPLKSTQVFKDPGQGLHCVLIVARSPGLQGLYCFSIRFSHHSFEQKSWPYHKLQNFSKCAHIQYQVKKSLGHCKQQPAPSPPQNDDDITEWG